MRKFIYSVSLLLLVSGCMVGPNYAPPENCVPDNWIQEDVCYADPKPDWWTLFQEPLLNKYIDLAFIANQDLKAAEANIVQARAMRQVAASQLFPQINADFNITRTYFSKNGPVFTFQQNSDTALPFGLQVPQLQTLFNALIDVSWEIDVFGRIRRNIEAADAQIGATFEQRNDLLLTIFAEIARNYIEVRNAQAQGRLVLENIELLENNAKIVEAQFNKGLINQLNWEIIQAQLAEAQAELPSLYAQIYQGIYAISVLTGSLPEALLCEMLPIQPLPQVPSDVAIGLRSDLLRRRPDIRYAERKLAQATANIGVAVASFFPVIALSGDIGFQSLQFAKLFQGRSLTWAIAGDANMPIFQGGKLVGNLRLAQGAALAAAAAYQQTVLNALRDAESAYISFRNETEATDRLLAAELHHTQFYEITSKRNRSGLVNVIDVLNGARDLNISQRNTLNSRAASLVNLVSLYKALGGGWDYPCNIE